MARVENVQLQVLNDQVRVTGDLKFKQAEIGDKYRVKILIYADDTGEAEQNTGPIYSFRFHETTLPGGQQLAATHLNVTAAATVSINETDNLPTSRLNEDPGHHWVEVGGTPVPSPNPDEVYAVIRLFDNDSPDTVIAFARSPRVTGIFA